MPPYFGLLAFLADPAVRIAQGNPIRYGQKAARTKLLPGERFTPVPKGSQPIRTMNGVPGRSRSDKRAFAKAVRQEQLRAKRAA